MTRITGSRPQSVAPELLERLTAALGVTFSFTDAAAAVVTSTAGRPRGQVDRIAMAVLQGVPEIERTREDRAADGGEADDPTALAGLYEPGAGVWRAVRVEDRTEGVLIAHGPPAEVREAARTAAVCLGLTLELAHAAARAGRHGPGPDLAMHQLLRGTRREARRAAVVARVLGWDVTLPRVALVVVASGHGSAATPLHPDHYAMIAEFVDHVAPGTPLARVQTGEWVLFPELPTRSATPAPRQLAQDVLTGLLETGARVTVGLGEPHAESSRSALRRSYREARHAARWGERLRGAGAVYRIRDLGAMAFVALDRATRARHAERLLHPLRSQPDVLESVRSYLECDRSIAAAGTRIGVHRHTIRHHLERTRELVGLDPRSLEDAMQLRLALLVAEPTGKPGARAPGERVTGP